MKKTEFQKYEVGRIAIDAVVLTIKDDSLWVYLNTREKDPYQGLAELPGGLLFPNETAEETLLRKVTDVIGLYNVFIQQFHTFTEPNRDPRTRTISIAYLALVPSERVKQWDHFYDLRKIPKMAFDHLEIITQARAYIKQNATDQLAKQLLPEYFPLNQAQVVYELMGGESFDNRNFRKKLLASGVVEKASLKQKNVTHRPATLFKFMI